MMARCAMMDSGIKVKPEVCKTKNMICGSLASSLLGFRVCKLSMALRPKGVAALSKPKKLAEKFITRWPAAGWLRGTCGKMREKNGPITLATNSMAPAFSPILSKPSHNVITPAKGSAMSMTAVLEALKVPSTMRLNTSTSPINNHCASAAENPTRKKPDQI